MDRLSDDQMVEFKKCAHDFVYFCKTYVKINHPKRGLIPLELHGYQERYIKSLEDNRFLIGKIFRQGGFTTITLAWYLWRCTFNIEKHFLVICKSDRHAVGCMHLFQDMLAQLPKFLSPLILKSTGHEMKFGSGSSITCRTPEACKGRAVDHIFIDNAAFISDMERHWKTLFPMVLTGGSVVAISTPNGKHGWFYNKYMGSIKGTNSFKVFDCSYLEHPEFATPEWQADMKASLDEKTWSSEYLGLFAPEEDAFLETSPKPKYPRCSYINITAKQERKFLEEHQVKPKAHSGKIAEWNFNDFIEESKKENKQPEVWSIDSVKPKGLDWDASDFAKKDEIPDIRSEFPPHKADVVEFAQFKTIGEIHEEFERQQQMLVKKPLDHPDINNIDQFDDEIIATWLEEEFKDTSWSDMLRKKREYFEDLENRIHDNMYEPELFVLAGVDSKVINDPRPDLQILYRVKEKLGFKDRLELKWRKNRLVLNGLPTSISEDDCRDAFNGMSGLTNYDEAMTYVVENIAKKLELLFRKEDE